MRTVWGKEWVRSQVFHEAGRKAWYTETRTNAGRALPGTLGGNIVNLLFFLTPKQDVAFIYEDFTLRQTLETWENHRYASIPVLRRTGEYVGTMTEGDILWGIKRIHGLDMEQAEETPISSFPRKRDYRAVPASTTSMEQLLDAAINENFVPVVDDRNVFIGIVRRNAILEYFREKVHESRALQQREVVGAAW